jgi:hypothetical protein
VTRKAVVSYAVEDTLDTKRRAVLDGIRDCAAELIELDTPPPQIVAELEQVANDIESGTL